MREEEGLGVWERRSPHTHRRPRRKGPVGKEERQRQVKKRERPLVLNAAEKPSKP